ncbi:hypothetical protein TCAL_14994 [Tigriopus californicus]|uniref:Uncharacterized protein n=1 Tax=Tigriopus californicus TaxID=6832 RepID=A0A553N7L4_TIGCA|nr:hypothetical protein TCAL_14994 [Tigriopus californicus]
MDLRTLLYDPDFIAVTKAGPTPAFTHGHFSNEMRPLVDPLPRFRFRRDITEPTSPSRNVEFLLEEARRHVEPEVLSQLDLTKDEDRKRLQALVDEKQAKGAKYVYQDEISDSYLARTEERDGLTTTGSYSYSDGYFEHTVAYVADANGYRVTKMDSRPIGDGPKQDKFGRAIVQSYVGGVSTQYAIKAEPLKTDDTKSEFRQDDLGQSPLLPADARLVDFTTEEFPTKNIPDLTPAVAQPVELVTSPKKSNQKAPNRK